MGANAEAILETLGPGPRAGVGGGFFAGGVCLVAAFIVALRGSAVRTEPADISASEAANYLTDRFTSEPDLWRVHLRTIKALVALIDAMTQQRDATESAVSWAGPLLSRRPHHGRGRSRYPLGHGDASMIWLLKLIFGKLEPLPPVQPDPPPWDVPLDQTMAPLHERGDVTSV